VVLALGVTGVLAYLVSLLGDDDDTAVLAAAEVSWLYSQTADGAELDDLGDGRYRLIMRGVDTHTIQFSDRPDRLVEIIDTSRLVHHWEELFADSAPNAVLVEHEPSGETDSLVVVLTDPSYDMAAGTLSYGVEILADEFHPERLVALADGHTRPPVMMRWVSLFIDSVQDITGGVGIDPSTIAGDGAQALLDKLADGDLGGGVHIESANVAVDPSTGAVSGTAVVTFDTAGFGLDVAISVTDAENWSLELGAMTSSTWTPANLPSLTIDPSTLSGSISMTDGAVSYDVVGTTHTWNMANGVTYVSTPELSADCPLEESQCPTGADGPYLSMTGTLAVAGVPSELALTGAITTDGNWARFDAVAGDVTFSGFGVTDATLTLWHGQRSDSYDPNMDLPSLATLNGGVDLEFCGGFTIPIPGHDNAATDGCLRWSAQGIVIGQVGVATTVSGSLPGAGAPASAAVKGIAWTNIPSATLAGLPSADVIMAGVHDALESQTITLAGQAKLPGVVAEALNIDLGAAADFVFDVTGSLSRDGFSLSAIVPANIHIGSEPFQTTINSITASIEASRSGEASFALGTTGAAVVGYSPNTRPINTSVQLVASAGSETGMALSVNAVGTKAAGDTGGDGLTATTRLSNPAGASYVWPDQFGIKGMNLWNLTVQIAFQDGSPALGYASTTYLDPQGSQTGKVIACQGPCDSADWMVGTLGFNISYTNPCFAYGFSSGSGTSGFSIDNGTITATAFKVGIAPTGCSIQSGGTQQSLPAGFAGFQFTAAFGSTTLEVATQVSADGFVFTESIDNLTLAGMTYETVALSIVINSSGSNIDFNADMTSGMGDMSVSSGFEAASSGVTQTLDATLSDWDWSSANVDIERLHFQTSTTIPSTSSGCANFSASADGSIRIAGSSITLAEGSTIQITCDGVEKLYFDLTYTHKAHGGSMLTEELIMQYPKTINGVDYFYGETDFEYKRHFSKKYRSRTFSKNVKITIDMSVTVNPSNPAASGFSFDGGFDADRVSGNLGCELPPASTDFSCSGRLRLNPSWAGVYHYSWDGL
jgi:hypothetical protein